jgi:hypothetical protein
MSLDSERAKRSFVPKISWFDQLMLLVDGAITVALVPSDPKIASVAREATRVLLIAAGVQQTSNALPTTP